MTNARIIHFNNTYIFYWIFNHSFTLTNARIIHFKSYLHLQMQGSFILITLTLTNARIFTTKFSIGYLIIHFRVKWFYARLTRPVNVGEDTTTRTRYRKIIKIR